MRRQSRVESRSAGVESEGARRRLSRVRSCSLTGEVCKSLPKYVSTNEARGGEVSSCKLRARSAPLRSKSMTILRPGHRAASETCGGQMRPHCATRRGDIAQCVHPVANEARPAFEPGQVALRGQVSSADRTGPRATWSRTARETSGGFDEACSADRPAPFPSSTSPRVWARSVFSVRCRPK